MRKGIHSSDLHMSAVVDRQTKSTNSSTHAGGIRFCRYREDEVTLKRNRWTSSKEEGVKIEQKAQEQPVAAAGSDVALDTGEIEQAICTCAPIDGTQQGLARLLAEVPCVDHVAEAEQVTDTECSYNCLSAK